MFKLIRPCNNCPFRKGMGPRYRLGTARLLGIFKATAFQCHKGIDYTKYDDPIACQGDNPQQCAGLMSILHREGKPNQIMQIGQRLGHFNPDKLDHKDVYANLRSAIRAHS